MTPALFFSKRQKPQMTTTATVVAAILAGCGGSQPPIGAIQNRRAT
jgi:hypothetical protein